MPVVSVNGTAASFTIGEDDWVRCSAPVTIRADRCRPVVQGPSLPMPYDDDGRHMIIFYKRIYMGDANGLYCDVVEKTMVV